MPLSGVEDHKLSGSDGNSGVHSSQFSDDFFAQVLQGIEEMGREWNIIFLDFISIRG